LFHTFVKITFAIISFARQYKYFHILIFVTMFLKICRILEDVSISKRLSNNNNTHSNNMKYKQFAKIQILKEQLQYAFIKLRFLLISNLFSILLIYLLYKKIANLFPFWETRKILIVDMSGIIYIFYFLQIAWKLLTNFKCNGLVYLRKFISLRPAWEAKSSRLIKVPELAHWVLLSRAHIRGGCVFFVLAIYGARYGHPREPAHRNSQR